MTNGKPKGRWICPRCNKPPVQGTFVMCYTCPPTMLVFVPFPDQLEIL